MQRKHRIGGEISSLAKVNVNEVAIFTESCGMVLIEQACSSFRSTLILCAQRKSFPKRTEWSEGNTNEHTNERTHDHLTIT